MRKLSVNRSVWRIVVVAVAGLTASPAGVMGQANDEKKDAAPRVVPWEHQMALSVAFSPDGKTLAVGSDQHLVGLYDPATLKVKGLLKGHPLPRINDLVFSPDGATLAAANGDYFNQNEPAEVWLWDVRTETVRARLKGHKGHVWSIAFTPDGKTLASCAADGMVTLWDAATGKEKATLLGHQGPVRRVTVAPDGKTLATGGFDGSITLWGLDPFEVKRTFPAHPNGVNALTFSPDGKTLASSGRFPNPDGVTVSLWNVASILEPPDAAEPQPRHNLTGLRGGRILAVAFSPNGKLLATGGGTYGKFGELKFYDPADGRFLWDEALPKSVDSLAFSPDGATLATAAGVKDEQGDVLLWKVAGPVAK